MYILDTDHLSILQRGGVNAQPLLEKLKTVDSQQVAVSIISYEEQVQGWLTYIKKAKTIEKQVDAYQQLKEQLNVYCTIPIFDFDNTAAQEFERLKKEYRRVGRMDLKIASIALVNQAVLLTRNQADFGQISGLFCENWTN